METASNINIDTGPDETSTDPAHLLHHPSQSRAPPRRPPATALLDDARPATRPTSVRVEMVRGGYVNSDGSTPGREKKEESEREKRGVFHQHVF